MAQVPAVVSYQFPVLSAAQLELISSGLSMLRVSSLRAVSKEPDAGVRDAREKRAAAIKALEVYLTSAKQV